MKKQDYIKYISLLLVLLWAYAALSKWSEFSAFGDQLREQPLPNWSVNILHWSLPVTEILIAVLICFQRTRLTGFIASFFLLFVFTLYVAFALTGVFRDIPCSCAGLITALHWKGHLIFNIVFMSISLAGIFLEKYKNDHFLKHTPATG